MKVTIYSLKQVFYIVFFLLANQLSAQRIITGTVTEADTREPLIGVNVIVQSESIRGTITDLDGTYSLEVKDGDILVFSYTLHCFPGHLWG